MAKYVPNEREIAEVNRAIEEAAKNRDTKKLMELRSIVANWKENKDHGDLEKTLGRRR